MKQSGRGREKGGKIYRNEERCEAEPSRNSEWRQNKSEERHERKQARNREWRQNISLSRERREVEQARNREWWRKDYFNSVFTTLAGRSGLPGRFTLKWTAKFRYATLCFRTFVAFSINMIRLLRRNKLISIGVVKSLWAETMLWDM